jgi:hypothetical protein
VLNIKFLVCSSWSGCLYLVTRSFLRRPQVLTFHLSTQPPPSKLYNVHTIRDYRAPLTYEMFKPALLQPQRSKSYSPPQDLLSRSDSTSWSYRLRLCQHSGCWLNASFQWMLKKRSCPSTRRDVYVLMCDLLHRRSLRVAGPSFMLICPHSLHVCSPGTHACSEGYLSYEQM